jgi:hypothetical protein
MFAQALFLYLNESPCGGQDSFALLTLCFLCKARFCGELNIFSEPHSRNNNHANAPDFWKDDPQPHVLLHFSQLRVRILERQFLQHCCQACSLCEKLQAVLNK